MPFGKRAELVLERTLFLSINKFFLRVGKLYLFVLTPLLLIELVAQLAGM